MAIIIHPKYDLDIVVINVYARGMAGGKLSTTVSQLDTFIENHRGKNHMVIAGDFNCTFEPLGYEDCSLSSDEDSNWGIPLLKLPPIKKWTKAALQLKRLCLEKGIRAVNGRSPSDSGGQHTYNNGIGSSRIDYFFINLELWPDLWT